MYSPNDLRRAVRHLPVVGAMTLGVACALLSPLDANAGVATAESRAVPPIPGAPKSVRGSGPMQVSCWQYGRLLFEETYVTLPGDGSQPAVKINATDRNGRPLYIAETQNATCLIRGVGESRGTASQR